MLHQIAQDAADVGLDGFTGRIIQEETTPPDVISNQEPGKATLSAAAVDTTNDIPSNTKEVESDPTPIYSEIKKKPVKTSSSGKRKKKHKKGKSSKHGKYRLFRLSILMKQTFT